ncbi:MAG: spore cortex biosynthesis protein YabQ [Clostridia bacterium]|nr:spore cortex biosynthesis protein YabQ [Clostridia bacterium]
MTVSINEQTLIFFSCVLDGILIGFIFDVFRILRTAYKLNKIFTTISDVCFWAIALFIVFMTIYITGDGQIRWFVFLGCAIGFLLYLFSISPLIVKTVVKIIRAVNTFLWKCLRILFRPFYKIFKFFAKKSGKLKKFVKSAQRKSGEKYKKTLAKLRRIGIILKKV